MGSLIDELQRREPAAREEAEELINALYSDPLVCAALARHRIP